MQSGVKSEIGGAETQERKGTDAAPAAPAAAATSGAAAAAATSGAASGIDKDSSVNKRKLGEVEGVEKAPQGEAKKPHVPQLGFAYE